MGYDPVNGDVGMVVSTWALAVGSRVPNVEAGTGAVASQANTNASLGPLVMDLLCGGRSPRDAVESALATDSAREQRQVIALNVKGEAFAWTGAATKPWSGHRISENVVAFGNLIVSEQVLDDALVAYRSTLGELRDRLLAAYRAGQAAGGDAQGVQSAVLRIARLNTYPFIDLRVDDHPSPIDELHRLVELAERSVAPRLPQLDLVVEGVAAPGRPVLVRVTHAGMPVPSITISANRQYRGLTGAAGELSLLFEEPADYYLVAAQPPTSTRAAASYQFAPAVTWVRVRPS